MQLSRKPHIYIGLIVFTFTGLWLYYKVIYSRLIIVSSQIVYYQDRIDKFNSYKPIIKTENKIAELQSYKNSLTSMFFKLEESTPEKSAADIKSRLDKNHIVILEYRQSENSVQFSIKGAFRELLNFFYELHKNNKIYTIPRLHITMIDNRHFLGNLEINRSALSKQREEKGTIPLVDFLTLDRPYNLEISDIMGRTYQKELTPKPTIAKEIKVDNKIEFLPSNKFTFIGVLKKKIGEITVFKERLNGRIYQFEVGKTIAGWTYIGRGDKSHLFLNNNKRYEVTE